MRYGCLPRVWLGIALFAMLSATAAPATPPISWRTAWNDALFTQAAKEKLPQVIQEFNIGEVVREKINNYPVEKLETLVMSVAKEHLRTIELFGALFGFIIGFAQALLSYWFFAVK